MKPDILLVEDISTALPIMELLESHYTVHVLGQDVDRTTCPPLSPNASAPW